MVNVGILGISGYSGKEALSLLLNHSQVRVTYVSANSTKGTIDAIWPDLAGKTKLICDTFNLEKAVTSADIFFLAMPHTTAMGVVPQLLKHGKTVIDLSADYRLDSADEYETWYKKKHTDKKNLKKAVYGLPEIYREDIKKAKFIANPGCYPTAALLGLAPFAATKNKLIRSVIIDAKSGVSGAGKKATAELSFCEVHENFKAYKVLNHQHAPEIELYLSKIAGKKTPINFVPHLLPVNRGILETIYVSLDKKVDLEKIHKMYQQFYKKEYFVRVLPLGAQAELKNVVKTNYCDISLALSPDGKLLVITSAIDNLVKGAAGQAIQNMNIICGFNETESLL